jgi:hypothetical protein
MEEYKMAKFKLTDEKIGTHEELWKMASTVIGSPSDEYPGGPNEDEFVNVYTCDEHPEYLLAYGRLVYGGKHHDFTWLRKKNQIGKVYYDEDPDGPIGKLKLESDSIHTVPQSEDFSIYTHRIEYQDNALDIFKKRYCRLMER